MCGTAEIPDPSLKNNYRQATGTSVGKDFDDRRLSRN